MCQYTPDNKRTKNTNQTKMCAIMVFYVYFVLYIELLFGNVGLNGSLISKLVLGQENTLTSSQILENQTCLIQIVESNGNNALNKEVFGEHENFNNGFGCIFIFSKTNSWRISALAFPLVGWGLDILLVGRATGNALLGWSKIPLSNL